MLVGFDLDAEPFAASAVDVDGLQFAALDLVQHGLSGNAERCGGLVEAEPAVVPADIRMREEFQERRHGRGREQQTDDAAKGGLEPGRTAGSG